MKILLINSDLARNRGDRAITEGVIKLIREKHPSATITGISECAKRDTEWFGINFMDASVTTLNPLKWILLAKAARQADYIYWGGGELLKDYTNKLGLWYWCSKLYWVSLFNNRIMGIGQGIGPTESVFSKKLIVGTVKRTKKFWVRDSLSSSKLLNWGVSASKIVSATDPAVIERAEILDKHDLLALNDTGIDQSFLDDFIAISPRNWFHYKKSGFLPHRVSRLFVPEKTADENIRYIEQLKKLIEITAKRTPNILIVPMHMSEDPGFCARLCEEQISESNLKILASDTISPKLLRNLLARARVMVGFRLHSNIIATTGLTPCINFYYVDKGKLYFDQINQSGQAFKIEEVLTEKFTDRFGVILDDTISNSDELSRSIKSEIDRLSIQTREAFESIQI